MLRSALFLALLVVCLVAAQDAPGEAEAGGACACEGAEPHPMCGQDGVTYPSVCALKCAGVLLKDHGAC